MKANLNNGKKQIPLEIEGISESLYAGFGKRLSAFMLDALFYSPLLVLTVYLNGLGKNIYFLTYIPNLAFMIGYMYLITRYGGTPGKLIVGIKIIRANDGESVGWKEVILRQSLQTLQSLIGSIVMVYCIYSANDDMFKSLPWLKRSTYLMSFSPLFFELNRIFTGIWFSSELIVMLINKRKRAIHDFIAGTVVVKAKYIENIRTIMTLNKTDLENKAIKVEFVEGF